MVAMISTTPSWGALTMIDLAPLQLGEFACPNPLCTKFGLYNAGNIGTKGSYGPNSKPLLCCRLCGKKFAATTGTALFGAHLPPETIKQIIHMSAEGVGVREISRILDMYPHTVNNVILRIGNHCAEKLSDLLKSLQMTEIQLDELWSFVKKKNVMTKYNKKMVK
jgi:transposase-like protein